MAQESNARRWRTWDFQHHHTTSNRSQPHASGARAPKIDVLYILGKKIVNGQSSVASLLRLSLLSLSFSRPVRQNQQQLATPRLFSVLSLPVLVVDLRAQVQHCIKIVPGQVGIQNSCDSRAGLVSFLQRERVRPRGRVVCQFAGNAFIIIMTAATRKRKWMTSIDNLFCLQGRR